MACLSEHNLLMEMTELLNLLGWISQHEEDIIVIGKVDVIDKIPIPYVTDHK